MLLNDVMLAVDAFVPPFATGRMPVTPIVSGKPVTFVITPEAGVPSAGVTRVGEVDITTLPVPVVAVAVATFEELPTHTSVLARLGSDAAGVDHVPLPVR